MMFSGNDSKKGHSHLKETRHLHKENWKNSIPKYDKKRRINPGMRAKG